MRIIGLTGGIACGKSTISLTLKSLGATIIDGDQLSRALTQSLSLIHISEPTRP